METYRKSLKSDRWEEWKNYVTDQKKGVPHPPPQKSYPDGATLIDLVAADDLTIGQMPVIQAIRRRRSRREFTDEPMTLEELSFLLWANQGINKDAAQAFGDWLATKDPDAVKTPSYLADCTIGGKAVYRGWASRTTLSLLGTFLSSPWAIYRELKVGGWYKRLDIGDWILGIRYWVLVPS